MSNVTLGDLVGHESEDEFMTFDFQEIQEVLSYLQSTDVLDIAHAEMLQQKSLRGADIISEYLGKVVKTVCFLENKLNSIKNSESLNYKSPDGSKVTADMRIWAGSISTKTEEFVIKLSKAKASKVVLEKKYDILIKNHHHYKDIATSIKKSIINPSNFSQTYKASIPEGYE